MRVIATLAAITASVSLVVACGGGGGGGGSATAPSGPPILPQSTSYLNFKNVGLTPQNLRQDFADDARAFGDFAKAGRLDLITASITYDMRKPIEQATPSRLRYWKKLSNGSFSEDSAMLNSNVGCIHPRKSLVADFNNDGAPDVFIVCHGYDAGDFPGEKNLIILSQPSGNFSVASASDDIGFWHGGTAVDVNNDGFVDVMLVDGNDTIFTMLNDGAGRFTLEAPNRFQRLPSNGYYTIEAVDINGDNQVDLLLGGHEHDGASTLALINPGDFNFANVTPQILPTSTGQGVVLDFAVTTTGTDSTIWVLRTGDNPFYQGRFIQKVEYPSLNATMALSDPQGRWVPWIIPIQILGQDYVSSDLSWIDFKVATSP
jgi:hypothetical protein